MIRIIAKMRDWLILAGSDELLAAYCGYTANEVLHAIEEMYDGGIVAYCKEQL